MIKCDKGKITIKGKDEDTFAEYITLFYWFIKCVIVPSSIENCNSIEKELAEFLKPVVEEIISEIEGGEE